MINKNVLACIMAFYPNKDFEDICNIIASQVGVLLIIDNSTDNSLLLNSGSLPDNIIIVANKNRGAVAGALNIALELARRKKFDYLQIFDQDTIPPVDITSSLVNALSADKDIAIVSPRFINLNTNHAGRVLINVNKWWVKSTWPRRNIGLVSALFTISSASLININILPVDLYYDERLIIDGCDVDFCLAVRDHSLSIKVDTSHCINHGIGNRKDGGGRWSPTNYSAYRKYLGAKNRMMVWRRHIKNYPGFVINDWIVFLLDTMRTVLLEKDRFKKFKSIVYGLKDGALEKHIALRKHSNSLEEISNIIIPISSIEN